MTSARPITTVQLRQFTDRDGQLANCQALCVEWMAERSRFRALTLLESPTRAKCLGWLCTVGVASRYTSEGVAEGVGGITCVSPGGI